VVSKHFFLPEGWVLVEGELDGMALLEGEVEGRALMEGELEGELDGVSVGDAVDAVGVPIPPLLRRLRRNIESSSLLFLRRVLVTAIIPPNATMRSKATEMKRFRSCRLSAARSFLVGILLKALKRKDWTRGD
jgi:hypothetical protein